MYVFLMSVFDIEYVFKCRQLCVQCMFRTNNVHWIIFNRSCLKSETVKLYIVFLNMENKINHEVIKNDLPCINAYL